MTQLIVIDARLPDVQTLVEAWAGWGEVLLLDGSVDGLAQIAAALDGIGGVEAIHIVANGQAGRLWLGSGSLDSEGLQASAGVLAQIGASLGENGDLLLYCPGVAAGEPGHAFVERLAWLTGADVAASGGFDSVPGSGIGWTPVAVVGSVETAGLPGVSGGAHTPDPIDGSAGDDSIDGGDTSELIHGLGGADTLAGGAGDDTLAGNQNQGYDPGDGDDQLSGGAGDDSLAGDNGADQLGGDAGADTLEGGAGDDLLDGGDGFDTAVFRLENGGVYDFSLLAGGLTVDDGQGGTDRLDNIEAVWVFGSGFDDTVIGSVNDDALAGGEGVDLLVGGDGNDTLTGGVSLYATPAVGSVDTPDGGGDTVLGGAGDDVLLAGRGFGDSNDTLDGGSGIDTLVLDYTTPPINSNMEVATSVALGTQAADLQGSPQAVDLGGDFGVQTVGGIERLSVTLTRRSDTFISTGSDDTLRGGAGNDTLDGGAGDDVLDGGSGVDVLQFGSAGGGIVIDFASGTTSGAAGNDRFTGFERVLATDYADTLRGSAAIDLLYGAAGDDSMQGGLGADDLYGQDGDDSLEGGAGSDDFYGGAGNDTLVGGGHGLNEYDFAIYADNAAGVLVDLGQGIATGAGIGTDTLVEIDGAIGSNHADTLIGSAGDNYLRGRGGSDRLDGGAGYDIADYRDAGATTASLVTRSASYAAGSNPNLPWAAGSDTLAGIEGLSGSYFADTLTGDAGDNYLRGQAGDDLIDGGAGIDRAAYNQATGAVTVNLATGRASGADGNDTLLGIENLRGSAYGDALTGDTLANHVEAREGHDTVDGGAGNDTLRGEAGDDRLLGGDGEDFLVGGAGNDTLDGGAQPANQNDASGRVGRQYLDIADYSEAGAPVDVDLAAGTASGDGDDTLVGIEAVRGSAGNDTLLGDAADNLFRGNAGDDSMAGGAGTDVVEYGNAAGSVVVDLAAGSATGAAGNDSFGGIEVAIGGAFDDTLIGSAGDNAIRGNAGDDWLDGGAGIDRIDYRTAGAGVIVDLAAGLAFGGEDNDTLAGFENVRGSDLYDDQLSGDAGANALEGRGGDDLLLGAAGNDTLAGDEGDDTLTGGLGNDQLQGGDGSDRYVLENRVAGTDTISDAGGTADTLAVRNDGFGVYTEFYRSGSSLVLEDYDELGSGALLSRTVVRNHAGTGRIERLESTDAASGVATVLAIAAGAAGSAGDDLVAGTTGNDTLTGADGTDLLWAHLGNDSLDGGSGGDALRGGAGADTLNGGSGADDLLGQAGNDVYIVDDAGDVVDERLGYGPNAAADAGGIDTVAVRYTAAGARYTLGAFVENLALQGTAAINGSGNALANRVTGNAAANTLDGAAGADTLTGGAGNDTYVVDSSLDVVVETSTLAGETDLVRSGVTWTLGSNLERLVLTGTAAIDGTGNTLANTLSGNAAANRLDGGAGHDTLAGGSGNDTLVGSVGNDSLTGGAGADVFRFASVPNAGSNLDRIADFSSVDDTLQLENAVFTSLTTPGTLAAANFRAGAGVKALDANDYLLYDTANGALWYDADGSGAGTAVQIAWLTGAPALSHLDFIVT